MNVCCTGQLQCVKLTYILLVMDNSWIDNSMRLSFNFNIFPFFVSQVLKSCLDDYFESDGLMLAVTEICMFYGHQVLSRYGHASVVNSLINNIYFR